MCVARGRYNSALSISAPRNLGQQNLPAVRRNAGGRCLVEWPARRNPLSFSLILQPSLSFSPPPTGAGIDYEIAPDKANERPHETRAWSTLWCFFLALLCRVYRRRCWLLFRLYRPILDIHAMHITARHFAGIRSPRRVVSWRRDMHRASSSLLQRWTRV